MTGLGICMVLCPCTEGDTCGYVQSTIQSWRGNKIFRLTKLKEYIWFKKNRIAFLSCIQVLSNIQKGSYTLYAKANVGLMWAISNQTLYVHF